MILITCPICSHLFKWVDERLPNFCPECSLSIIKDLKQEPGKWIQVLTQNKFGRFEDLKNEPTNTRT